MPTLPLPIEPNPAFATATDRKIWELEISKYVKRKVTLESNLKKVYGLIWGQCAETMRSKIEALSTYHRISRACDSLELLKAIKDICFNFQDQQYKPHALHMAKRRFYTFYQD